MKVHPQKYFDGTYSVIGLDKTTVEPLDIKVTPVTEQKWRDDRITGANILFFVLLKITCDLARVTLLQR